jgi:DNA modification methylase
MNMKNKINLDKSQLDLFAKKTNESNFLTDTIILGGYKTKRVTGEFWTSKQRQASTIHEVSYRACFKPQLPNYFIDKYTQKGDVVYDPFGGRGTTAIEAALMGRNIIQNDINPISEILSSGRLLIPTLNEIEQRLKSIKLNPKLKNLVDLTMFYEKKTLIEILSLRDYLIKKDSLDHIDKWIRMVATNRLTGHSSGFFSVYTFPPNQAVSAESQIKINQKRKQVPEYRNTNEIILKKSKQLIKGLSPSEILNLKNASKKALYLNKPSDKTNEIKSNSVSLVVTSPPFLDIVQYKDDNWLRCWFNGIDAEAVGKNITMAKTLELWSSEMKKVLIELKRVLKKDGFIAFEVGEVRNGKIKLDESIVPLGIEIGLKCESVLINSQVFTKTSNLWGVSNNSGGTNSNRIVIFRKI